MYKFASHMYKYSLECYEKQERKINGDQTPDQQSEYIQPGEADEAFSQGGV